MNRVQLQPVAPADDRQLVVGGAGRGRPSQPPALRRGDVWGHVIDGQPIRDSWLARLAAWCGELATSHGERAEAELVERLLETAAPTRANVVASVSPKGGVGKTTCAFVLSDLVAEQRKLATLCLDANRDHGTLASLAGERDRVALTLSDLLEALDQVRSRSELARYVTQLPSGLHVLAAPRSPEAMAELTPTLYGELLEFLRQFYDLIVLDLGTGIVDELTQFGLERADQALVITEPKFVTAEKVLEALRYLNATGGWDDDRDENGYERLTVVVNRIPDHDHGQRTGIERAFHEAGITRHIALPYDAQLDKMLDTATYSLEALRRPTRMPIRELAAAVAGRFV